MDLLNKPPNPTIDKHNQPTNSSGTIITATPMQWHPSENSYRSPTPV
ncbi:MAG: hypothetical protein AB1899_06170 [Pseudomonadota bacterium]